MPDARAQHIYHIVQSIPRGKVAAYASVARRAGMPRAARYVGNVLNKNRDPDVPCHRVVRSDGYAGGYRDGTSRKVRLLLREGVHMRGNRVDEQDFN